MELYFIRHAQSANNKLYDETGAWNRRVTWRLIFSKAEGFSALSGSVSTELIMNIVPGLTAVAIKPVELHMA